MIGAALRLETPEGIDLELSPAGPAPRGLAILIDGAITQIGTTIALLLLSLGGSAGVGLYLILLFLVEWFYPVLFEVLRGGQTPGKKMIGLRVVNADATPIGWNASIVRNLLRVVDFFPLFYVGGIVSMLISSRYQRLGDLAADTLVVHAARMEDLGLGLLAADDDRLGARIAPVSLSAADQRAILAYAERRSDLSLERAVELSNVLEPLTGARGDEGMREVVRIANGIVGRA
ncbi:MAG: RDD family protein [Deltaproteobacteria bacterium]|nr:RDD family protein [Deltaproteobacteria bacterium]